MAQNRLPPTPAPTFVTALAVALLASFTITPASAAPKAKAATPVIKATNTKALKANVGKKVTVEGKVISTGKGPKDGMRFINFSDAKTTGFTAALVPAVYDDFPNLNRMVT